MSFGFLMSPRLFGLVGLGVLSLEWMGQKPGKHREYTAETLCSVVKWSRRTLAEHRTRNRAQEGAKEAAAAVRHPPPPPPGGVARRRARAGGCGRAGGRARTRAGGCGRAGGRARTRAGERRALPRAPLRAAEGGLLATQEGVQKKKDKENIERSVPRLHVPVSGQSSTTKVGT